MQELALFILRPSAEIGLKTLGKRQVFLRKLEGNISVAFQRAGIPHKLIHGISNYFLETPQPQRARHLLTRIFGLSSFSPVWVLCDSNLASICDLGEKNFAPIVEGKTFCVRCRRVGPKTFSSQQVQMELGARLAKYGKVQLSHPEVTVGVEIYNKKVFMYWEKILGAKGFPSGVQSRALALVSGGYDSPVAAWRIMRRGVHVDYVFFNLGGRVYERQVLQIVKVLVEAWAFGQNPKLYIVDFASVLNEIKTKIQESYRQVILKRLIVRAASQIAKEIKAHALITGESIAQVSSQTLPNLDIIAQASGLQILRPLIGSEKEEIIAQAKTIGTALLSAKVQEHCSITRGSPVIFAKPYKVQIEESKINRELLDEVVKNKKVFDVFSLEAKDLRKDYLWTNVVMSSDILLDCQPKHLYKVWHAEGAISVDVDHFMDFIKQLDKKKRYILYCTHGTQTPALAELMQQMGYDAYAFEGGVSQLKTLLTSRFESSYLNQNPDS